MISTARDIEVFFQTHTEDLNPISDLAQEIRQAIILIDPFIQRHTSAVCPQCRKVCCINKHAYYSDDDLIYLYALGQGPHAYVSKGDLEPCQFLSVQGCNLDRTIRPSGCNWYFCDPLFKHMEDSPGKTYAEFDDSLQRLADLWMELIARFHATFRKISGSEMKFQG